jgi:hypothetical protein
MVIYPIQVFISPHTAENCERNHNRGAIPMKKLSCYSNIDTVVTYRTEALPALANDVTPHETNNKNVPTTLKNRCIGSSTPNSLFTFEPKP